MDYQKTPLKELVKENPVYSDFFISFNLNANEISNSFDDFINITKGAFWEEIGLTPQKFKEQYVAFVNAINKSEEVSQIKSLEILPGIDKSGQKEKCYLKLVPGEITCIVGPTGSGKSRLLADIEWLANSDTPTQRKILVNGEVAGLDINNQFGGKLIAQITQNMNFVLDMNVYEFLMLHAQSRLLGNAKEAVLEVLQLANELSGESFSKDTPVTFLSGGQSRALMIADVACIGQAPIVLIDEIENAGVNKKKALDLLVAKDKIVLMATHDPLLILLADKRVVIKNGGIQKVVTTNKVEKKFYKDLEEIDNILQRTKDFFRLGNELNSGEVELLISKSIAL